VGFEVAAYDPTRPLIIDPVLSYSTYLGGSGEDLGLGIAVDGTGNTYVTGSTGSTDFPTTSGSLQPTLGVVLDAFVAKLNAAGSALAYATYLGGNSGDTGSGIAVDSTGSAYVTGSTLSTDFPTQNALQPTFHGGGFVGDVFVAKLNAAGSALAYATYLGGSNDDQGLGIAVDSTGSAYVTGLTGSTDFRSNDFPTQNALQPIFGGGTSDAFVAKISGVITVTIDIKPGSFPNSINPKSKGLIPVAILTTDTFDATTVDPLSVKFGPNEATKTHRKGHKKDVDGDGDIDLVLHFRTQATGIKCGDTSASLTGETLAGQAIEGSDSIKTVGCKKK
jgi:hypothetical protein